MDTDEQCKRFGCDLIDLLRREGRWSGVWFGDRLLQAADELEKAARPTADLGDDGDLVERLRAPAYWMSGSSDGHEGENYAPLEAADRLILYREARDELVKIIADAVEELKPFSPELDEADISEALYKRMTAVLSRSGG